MVKQKKTRKFAEVKRMISPKDERLNFKEKGKTAPEKRMKDKELLKIPKQPASMFFSANNALGPPYHILLDTNFINFSIQNKLDVMQAAMDCLYAKCTIYISDCVMAELEKLGSKYKVALRIARDSRFERLPCQHKGTYADDCLVDRCTQHRCFIVATCDKLFYECCLIRLQDLKRRIRKIPGVPIMYISERRFSIERLPEAYGAPRT